MLAGIYDSFQHWGEKHQTVWIYSDPHFNDDELAGGIKDRPSAEEQVKRINAKCGRRDCLIILGDVGDVEYVRQLRAEYKVLIMGNHDAGASNYKRQVIKEIYNQAKVSKEEVLANMRAKYPNWKITIREEWDLWIADADNLLFDEVYEGALIIGEKLILTHEPVEIPWLFNIHGHVHSLPHGQKSHHKHFNCCSDAIGYNPINLNQWLKQGYLANIQTIHRETIDKATEKKKKRNGKKIAETQKTCVTRDNGSKPLTAGGVHRRRYYEGGLPPVIY